MAGIEYNVPPSFFSAAGEMERCRRKLVESEHVIRHDYNMTVTVPVDLLAELTAASLRISREVAGLLAQP